MKRVILTCILLGLLVALARLYVWISGSVTVHDDVGAVDSAVIASGEIEYPLFRLPGGVYFRTMPRIDAEIEVRCRDGSRARGEYVTHHDHLTVHVIDGAPCRLGPGSYE